MRAFEELPIYLGRDSPIDIIEHGGELTARALSLDSNSVGVVYVDWDHEREFAVQFMTWVERFFCYSQKEGRPLTWLILSNPVGEYDEIVREVARWSLNVLYRQDESFKSWLEKLGLQS